GMVEAYLAELKWRVGVSRVDILVPEARDLAAAAAHASDVLGVAPTIDPATRQVSLSMHGGAETLARLAGRLAKIGLQSEDLSLHRPDLDEVFLQLTEPKPGRGESL